MNFCSKIRNKLPKNDENSEIWMFLVLSRVEKPSNLRSYSENGSAEKKHVLEVKFRTIQMLVNFKRFLQNLKFKSFFNPKIPSMKFLYRLKFQIKSIYYRKF